MPLFFHALLLVVAHSIISIGTYLRLVSWRSHSSPTIIIFSLCSIRYLHLFPLWYIDWFQPNPGWQFSIFVLNLSFLLPLLYKALLELINTLVYLLLFFELPILICHIYDLVKLPTNRFKLGFVWRLLCWKRLGVSYLTTRFQFMNLGEALLFAQLESSRCLCHIPLLGAVFSSRLVSSLWA